MNITKTIYVVDDDQAVRESTRALLEARGYVVHDFAGSAIFLDKTHGQGADCLLLDIHMPGLTGIELLELLRKRGITTPAILMTGRSDPLLGSRISKTGAVGVLLKPLSGRKLLDWIKDALDGGSSSSRQSLSI